MTFGRTTAPKFDTDQLAIDGRPENLENALR